MFHSTIKDLAASNRTVDVTLSCNKDQYRRGIRGPLTFRNDVVCVTEKRGEIKVCCYFKLYHIEEIKLHGRYAPTINIVDSLTEEEHDDAD